MLKADIRYHLFSMANFYQPQAELPEVSPNQVGSRVPIYAMQKGMRETDPEQYKFPENDPQYFKPNRRKGLWRHLLNCRCLGMGCVILLVLGILLVAWVLVSRPPEIVNPTKEWLNAGLVGDEIEPLPIAEVNQELSAQVLNFGVGENTLRINELQLRSLLLNKIESDAVNDVYLHIEQDRIKFFWDIESMPDNPLWLVVELTPSGDGTQTTVAKVGTERVALPSFLNSFAEDVALSLLNLSGANTENGLVGILLPLPSNVQITGMEIVRSELNILLNVSTGLENLFQ